MAPFAVTMEFTKRSSMQIRDISFVTSVVELDVNKYIPAFVPKMIIASTVTKSADPNVVGA